MANKKSNTSRLFQLALNDVIKSSAEKLERNSQWISAKEMIPQTMDSNLAIASKQKSPLCLIQQLDSPKALPLSKGLDKSCQKTSQPPTNGIADRHPVSFSLNSSNCSSLTSKNTIPVQDCSASNYAFTIPVCEPQDSSTKTDCNSAKWINPPKCNPTSCFKNKDLSRYEFGCGLFPEVLPATTYDAQISEESGTVEWSVTNELGGIESTIPPPKSATDFFNSSAYTDKLKAQNCSPNPKRGNILSDSFEFHNQIGTQNVRIAIPKPKDCDNSIPCPFTVTKVWSSTNEILLQGLKDHDCFSDSATNNVYSTNFEGSISRPKSPNFFDSIPYSDQICMSNERITIPSPKSYSSFSSSVPLTNKVYTENELQKPTVCNNLFQNDYLDELIKIGSKDSDISSNETDFLKGILETDSKLPNVMHTSFPENVTHTSFEKNSLVDLEDTSISGETAIKLTDLSLSNLDFDYWMNKSKLGVIISNPESHLDLLNAKQNTIKPVYCKTECSFGGSIPLLPDHFDPLSADSTNYLATNLTASETKFIDNFNTSEFLNDKRDTCGKTASSLLCSVDQEDEFSTSKFTSLNSLVNSNLDNSTDIRLDITDRMSVNSCSSNSASLIDEPILSDQNYSSFSSGMFFNDSKSKSLLECNIAGGSSVCKNNFFSRPSKSIDSGIGFLLEDAISSVSLDKSSTRSEPELNVFSLNTKDKSPKLVSCDNNVINVNSEAECELDHCDFLVDDQQRIDNLIDQFMGM